jgi:aldehyde:ferredoxin oxidoreductase
MALRIKPKKACCKSNPRCKRCPVVCKRLVNQGLAERRADGIVVLDVSVTKKQIKRARKR